MLSSADSQTKENVFSWDQAAHFFPSVHPSVHRTLLPKASFGLRVLLLPASVCLCVSVCVCLSVCVSVNPELVRAKTRHPFKLETTNLDKRCKTAWLRSLLFFGAINLDLQCQSPNLPFLEPVRTITHQPFKLGSPNLDQRCKTPWLSSLLFWGAIDLDLQDQI